VEIFVQLALLVQYLQVNLSCSQRAWKSSLGRGSAGLRRHCRKHADRLRFLHRYVRNRGRRDAGTMGTRSSRDGALVARRGGRGTARRCRRPRRHCRDVCGRVSLVAVDLGVDAMMRLTRRYLCAHRWCTGSGTSAVVACGQPCLLGRHAHAVVVREERAEDDEADQPSDRTCHSILMNRCDHIAKPHWVSNVYGVVIAFQAQCCVQLVPPVPALDIDLELFGLEIRS
jgi:hypothetical protein